MQEIEKYFDTIKQGQFIEIILLIVIAIILLIIALELNAIINKKKQ